MFTALKKLVNHSDRPLGEDEFAGSKNGQSNHHKMGVNPMDQHLQRKFARGVQYNSEYSLTVVARLQ